MSGTRSYAAEFSFLFSCKKEEKILKIIRELNIHQTFFDS